MVSFISQLELDRLQISGHVAATATFDLTSSAIALGTSIGLTGPGVSLSFYVSVLHRS